MAVIDAGSSGSQIYIYKYFFSPYGYLKFQPDPATFKSKVSIASFVVGNVGMHRVEHPHNAGESLEPLLEFAEAHIPDHLIESTPIVLKATLGMRQVQQRDERIAHSILQSVRKTLGNSKFRFRPSYAEIMTGEEEGTLGWLALNYLHETKNADFRYRSSSSEPQKAVWSVLNMGGSSVHVNIPLNYTVGIPDEYIVPYSHNWLGYSLIIFTRPFDGFGIVDAKASVERMIPDIPPKTYNGGRSKYNDEKHGGYNHPCYPSGYRKMPGYWRGIGSFEECQDVIVRQDNPANNYGINSLWNSIDWPDLNKLDRNNKLWAYGIFYNIMSSVGEIAADEAAREFSIADYKRVAKETCGKPWKEIDRNYPKDTQPREYNSDLCFSALYAYSFLTLGLGFDPQQRITIGNKVEKIDIHWTLGVVVQHMSE